MGAHHTSDDSPLLKTNFERGLSFFPHDPKAKQKFNFSASVQRRGTSYAVFREIGENDLERDVQDVVRNASLSEADLVQRLSMENKELDKGVGANTQLSEEAIEAVSEVTEKFKLRLSLEARKVELSCHIMSNLPYPLPVSSSVNM